MRRTRVLFISYDGLTDPLGQSQILPYIFQLQTSGRQFTILSFEKPDRYRRLSPQLRRQLEERNIHWHPLSFTRRPRYLAKGWDLLRMYALAMALTLSRRIQVVHCRSYQAGQVGLFLQRLFSVQMVFDMRGLWADERVDGGLWKMEKPFQWLLYHSYRRLERQMLRNADQIVTLTRRSLPTITQRCPERDLPLWVIPCCADFEHFQLASPTHRARIRQELGLTDGDLLLGYLGSLGTWYLLREMFQFFAVLLEHQRHAHLFLITMDWQPQHEQIWQECGLDGVRHRLHIRPATREEVPQVLSALDLAVSFILPSFSKQASSPTKVAELLATGIPLVCNQGVGDVQEQMEQFQAGICIQDFSRPELVKAAVAIPQILGQRGQALRQRAATALDLSVAARIYLRIYAALDEKARPI
ncbi:glycosyltransferase [bacterium]|nr:glycosyltransferase [bacterium]